MKYIIVSDIHSNLEAFKAVVESFPVDVFTLICAGDLVGYGADPSGCIKLFNSFNGEAVLGNHDAASSGKNRKFFFNDSALKAMEWTRHNMSGEEREFLRALPLIKDIDGFTVTHGTLHYPEKYIYMTNAAAAMHTFEMMDKRICFVGHSHRPCVFKYKNGKISECSGKVLYLDPHASYIINAGSVGQPRDYDNRACYCVYDNDKNFVEFFRIVYDIEKARGKIIDAGLPERLGNRLRYGL